MNDLITAEELAKTLGLPRESIWRLTREHILPAYRVGRQFRYAPELVEKAISQEDEGNNS